MQIAELVLVFYPEIDNTHDFVKQLVEYNLPNTRSFVESNAIFRVINKYTNQLDEGLSKIVFKIFRDYADVKGAYEWKNVITDFLEDGNTFFKLDKAIAREILDN
jgi:beta-galactosidase beta subunit